MITVKEAAELLIAQDNLTILCHRSPDGDTMGSGCALYHGLRQLGKGVRLLCADPVPPDIAGFAGNIEDCCSGEGYIVAVDVADPKLLGSLRAEYSERVELVIDHHPSNTGYSKNTCLVPTAAATAEIVAELLSLLGVTITKQIADCLYIGIATDTGCFRYSNTTAATLRAAATLLEQGADNDEINSVFFETKKRGRLALECSVLQSIEYYLDGRCAVMTVPMALVAQHNVSEDEMDGLSAMPRQIEGVIVGVTIREQPDSCRVSVRTTREADASAVCAAFGGGGHIRAGGCLIKSPVAEAKARLVAEIARQLGQGEG